MRKIRWLTPTPQIIIIITTIIIKQIGRRTNSEKDDHVIRHVSSSGFIQGPLRAFRCVLEGLQGVQGGGLKALKGRTPRAINPANQKTTGERGHTKAMVSPHLVTPTAVQ